MSPLLVCNNTLVLVVAGVDEGLGDAVGVDVGVAVGVAEVGLKLFQGCATITDAPITMITIAIMPIISQRFLFEPLRFG
jgi:hypothetical protein